MNDWLLFGGIGLEHILTPRALDHILFLVALTAAVELKAFKTLFILITAFTLGHSITLVLSTYNLIFLQSAWVEFLIPLTIVITASTNLYLIPKKKEHQLLSYLTVLVFGLIHGMGFANDLKMMLAKEERIFIPLLSMNIGLEIAQMIVVTTVLLLSWLIQKYVNISDQQRSSFLSVIALIGGLFFSILNLPF